MNIFKQIILTFLTVILMSCQTTGNSNLLSQGSIKNPYPQSADSYLQLAQNSYYNEKYANELKAAGRLMQDGMDKRAKQILTNLSSEHLSYQQKIIHNILLAKLDLSVNKTSKAVKRLSSIEQDPPINLYYQLLYHELLANAYFKQHKIISSVNQLIELSPLLPNQNYKLHNQQKIWNTLNHLSAKQLINDAQVNKDNYILSGWLTLAAIPKLYPLNSHDMLIALKKWQHQFKNHPGTEIVASSLSKAKKSLQPAFNKIALLLPLSGNLQQQGETVRDGFMDSYYQALDQGYTIAKVSFYDSASTDVSDSYAKAIADGADLVIGPLQKSRAETIAHQKHPVTTILLNYPHKGLLNHGNLYEFGLSPLDEAQQSATKMISSRYFNVLVIAPNTSWGQNVSSSFKKQFEKLHGNIVGELNYKHNENFNTAIKQLLHVDQSNIRDAQIASITGQKTKFIPRRREDVDAIFLLAPPKIARQIKPMLRYYYAGDIPVYANSLTYSGTPSPLKDNDLNGIFITDLPWMYQNGKNHHGKNARLFALGKDAFNLSYQLNQLILFPKLGISNSTGTLYLNQDKQVIRTLSWGRFISGTIKPLKS